MRGQKATRQRVHDGRTAALWSFCTAGSVPPPRQGIDPAQIPAQGSPYDSQPRGPAQDMRQGIPHRSGRRSRCMRTGHPTASRPRLLKHTSPCAGRQDDRKELPKDPPRILPASGCCFFRCPEEALQAHLKAYILPMRPDHRRRMPSVRQPGQNDPCFSGDTPTAGGQSRVLNRRCAEYSTAAPHLEAVSRIEERIFRRSLPVRETLLYRDVMLAHAVTSARRVFFPFFAAMLSGRIPGRLPLRAI